MSVAEKGRRYRHYKKETMVYTVVEIALDCETVEPLVIYRSEYETPDHPRERSGSAKSRTLKAR
jgi:hypothetical protein